MSTMEKTNIASLLKWTEAPEKNEIAEAVVEQVVLSVRQAVAKQGLASLLLSGGSTPQEAYRLMAQAQLPWDQLQVSLTDERRVVDGHPALNAVMVWQRLLASHPQVQWFPLWQTGWTSDSLSELKARTAEMQRPFDVTILGMGEDGHFASLFPNCAASQSALEGKSDQVVCTQAPAEPRDRISWSMNALLESKVLMLYITGDRKKQLLQAALEDGTPESKLPIGYLLRALPVHHKTLMVFWAP